MVEGAQRGLRALAGGDDDLLVRHRGHVARREDARHAGVALGVDDDLAEAAQLHRALQELGVGHQADLHEHAGQRQPVLGTGDAVLVDQAVHLLAVTGHLGGLGIEVDGDVGHAPELVHQHLVGLELVCELQQGDALDHAGQVDGRLDAGIAAADHRHVLALEQRAVTVRAVGHALGAVLGLSGHVHVAPAGAGGQDHAARQQSRAVLQRHRGMAARLVGRVDLGHPLQGDDVTP